MSKDINNLMDVVTPYLANKTMDVVMKEEDDSKIPSQFANPLQLQQRPTGTKKPSNSTSTIYANSTISHPNESEVLQSVASVMHCIMLQSAASPTTPGGNTSAPDVDPNLALFDERTYTSNAGETRKRLRWGFNRPPMQNMTYEDPMKRLVPDEGVPPATEIYYFLMACSQRASFSSECSIIALVLLNRLLSLQHAHLVLHAFNWRLFFLTSILVAQKIWEDIALANIDFPVIWRHAVQVEDNGLLDVKAFNNMEAKYLELLNFNVYVSTSLYGQFCFELRTIHHTNNKNHTGQDNFPLAPLTPQQAAKLEANTSVNPDVLRAHVRGGVSKSATSMQRGKAGQFVLS